MNHMSDGMLNFKQCNLRAINILMKINVHARNILELAACEIKGEGFDNMVIARAITDFRPQEMYSTTFIRMLFEPEIDNATVYSFFNGANIDERTYV